MVFVVRRRKQRLEKASGLINTQDRPMFIREGTQKTQNLFIKNCVFILTYLYFSHLQRTLHLLQYTYRDVFSCSKQFLNLLIWMPFSASDIFCFTSSTSTKHFPLRTFFQLGKQKQSRSGQDRVNREGREQGSCRFWSNTAGPARS